MALVIHPPPPPSTRVYGTSPLTPDEEAMIRRAGANEPLVAVYLLDNQRTDTLPTVEEGDSGDKILTGAAYEFRPNAVVRTTSPLFALGDRLFGHVLVAAVRDATVDETALRKRLALYRQHVHVTATQPYSFRNRGDDSGLDSAPWGCALGAHGHFVGLYVFINYYYLLFYLFIFFV
jgi:hypothetical protein